MLSGLVEWDDPIRAGDEIQVADDVVLTPEAGWGLQSGLRVTDRTASGQRAAPQVVLATDGVALLVRPGPWDGTSRALLDQVDKITATTSGDQGPQFSGDVRTVRTGDGVRGVSQAFRSARGDGLVAAFVFGGEGISVQAFGPPEEFHAHAGEIETMIASLREAGR